MLSAGHHLIDSRLYWNDITWWELLYCRVGIHERIEWGCKTNILSGNIETHVTTKEPMWITTKVFHFRKEFIIQCESRACAILDVEK